ncbi:LOW QUALITY PROTEIN: Transposon Polyprotein integrase [Phytophthora palmivora]|uniref:Transposon Polyprotein integrase n=1 Tax=Phytophthora palmivora TaxID=4796 RepID=A0A2P4Y8K4_9STRA|nr:LOW QUALITY PROTEIN: Transposon Polyprotein integrase [Phytophthora palmivora]
MTVHMIIDKKQGEAKIQKKRSKPVNWIVSDTGGEFYKTSMENWCASQGIKLVPYALDGSKSNPNIAKHDESHDEPFRASTKVLADALRNATYKSRLVQRDVPDTFELFFGRKPDIHHIKTFGALVYAHIPKRLRTKMAKTSEAGFLLGYLEDHIGCKVYFPQHHVSRVVYTVRVHEDILHRDRQATPKSVDHGWPSDQNGNEEEGDSDDEDDVNDFDNE